jgi:glycerol-3-phosphate dehydrogenase (NAD(P)+)
MPSANITIIGTGSWGTTLAVLWSRLGLNVTLWARTADEATELNARRENVTFMPGIPFPLTLRITHDLAHATRDAHLILLVVPSQTFRANVRALRELVRPEHILISATKGLELETLLRMSEVMRAELPHISSERLCVLSGPNIARELAAGLPASSVIAAPDEQVAREAQALLMTPLFRIYTHSDVVGVELAGAIKNVMAIAAGVADGFNIGENAKATLLTRALAEMSRLGVACGANPITFAGLAGIGDLICTCNSRHSRNHTVGEKLAQGQTLDEILAAMKMVAEGVTTTKAARQLAARCGVEMPLVEQVYAVLFEGKSPRQAIGDLMGRGAKSEFYGISNQ